MILRLLVLMLLAGCGPAATVESLSEELTLPPARTARIAVVGAGAAGLTAAYTLRQLGYTHVTVFEKENRVGGKVYSYRLGETVVELGAALAPPEYRLVLGLADRYRIPYRQYGLSQIIVDEYGYRQTPESFLTSRYGLLQIAAAARNYRLMLGQYASIQRDGFAWLPSELDVRFDAFADWQGFRPIAEVARSPLVGFGYGYFETTPAMYHMKIIGWMAKPVGLFRVEPGTFYMFPTGFQSIWDAVARDLGNVRLGAEVTSITRRPASEPSRIQLAVNGGPPEDFDVVIVSAALDKVSGFMTLSPEEQQLFSQVRSYRYVVTLFNARGLGREEMHYLYANARPSRIDHANLWLNRDRRSSLFTGYQLARPATPSTELATTLARDVAAEGGRIDDVLLQQEWDYFPHVQTQSLQNGFYERIEGLQGKNATYYVGATLGFETVEHSAGYAQDLMLRSFY